MRIEVARVARLGHCGGCDGARWWERSRTPVMHRTTGVDARAWDGATAESDRGRADEDTESRGPIAVGNGPTVALLQARNCAVTIGDEQRHGTESGLRLRVGRTSPTTSMGNSGSSEAYAIAELGHGDRAAAHQPGRAPALRGPRHSNARRSAGSTQTTRGQSPRSGRPHRAGQQAPRPRTGDRRSKTPAYRRAMFTNVPFQGNSWSWQRAASVGRPVAQLTVTVTVRRLRTCRERRFICPHRRERRPCC